MKKNIKLFKLIIWMIIIVILIFLLKGKINPTYGPFEGFQAIIGGI